MAWLKLQDLEKFSNKFAAKVSEIFAKKTDIPQTLPADGGNAYTVNGHTVETDVPAGAKFTDTAYDIMSGATASTDGRAGLVPTPLAGKQNAFFRGDGTWEEMEEATDADIDAIIAGSFKE